MSHSETQIDHWLVSLESSPQPAWDEGWESGFDANRQVVYSQFGPYKKLFIRPQYFIPRFYHTVYPLPIEEWHSFEQIKLYEGFCTMDVDLTVRFQATLPYAQSHLEIISELNEQIKQTYHDLALDQVNQVLMTLSSNHNWVEKGVAPIEQSIVQAINEMLVLQNIQSQAECQLTPYFEHFPHLQLGKEAIYLSVLKKDFEINQRKREVLFCQQQQQEQQKIAHKRQQLKQLDEISTLDCQKQSRLAENTKRLLEQKLYQQKQRFEVKKQLHQAKIAHNAVLRQMSREADLDERQAQYAQLSALEAQEKLDTIAQKAKIEERKLEVELALYHRKKASWQAVKYKAEADFNSKNKARFQKNRKLKNRSTSNFSVKREIERLHQEKQQLQRQLSKKNNY